MAKYDPLRDYLSEQSSDRVELSFSELAAAVGDLPPSAYEHRAWWANTRSHPNAVAWLDAGFELVDVSLGSQRAVFQRASASPTKSEPLVPVAAEHRVQPSRTSRRQRRQDRLSALIQDFSLLLDEYDDQLPFDRSGQYELHRRTIDERRRLGSVAEALEDPGFTKILRRTLEAWGIGKRASVLAPLPEFVAELRSWIPEMEALETARIDDPQLDSAAAAASLWRLIDGLEIVDNQAKLVSSSKTLHHLLPDLVPPIDRMYTQEFFLFHSPEFQYGQQQVFAEIWDGFVTIARAVDPASYVGAGWRTSRSKVIDNAIVAYLGRDAK